MVSETRSQNTSPLLPGLTKTALGRSAANGLSIGAAHNAAAATNIRSLFIAANPHRLRPVQVYRMNISNRCSLWVKRCLPGPLRAGPRARCEPIQLRRDGIGLPRFLL